MASPTLRATLRPLALAAMLGFAAAVGLAWWIAAFRPMPAYPRTILGAFEQGGRAWSVSESTRFGTIDVWWMDLRSGAPGDEHRPASALVAESRTRMDERAGSRPGTATRHAPRPWGSFARGRTPDEARIGSDTAYGWPWPCLWYRVNGQFTSPTTIANERLAGAIHLRGPVSARLRDFRALPYWPIWSGLIANTAGYTLMWWMFLVLPGLAWRAWRRRRGRCPACGYDLRHDLPAGCPECGWNRAAPPAPIAPKPRP